MADPARKRATYADVLAAAPHMVAELVDGELRLHPRPAKPHAVAATALGESSWLLRHAWRDDARVRAEPFDAIELDLSILWADVVLPE